MLSKQSESRTVFLSVGREGETFTLAETGLPPVSKLAKLNVFYSVHLGDYRWTDN
jgi:hypothetical protein